MVALTKIISGGQTGADQAGLRAARTLGIATGGFAPRGWETHDGPAPWLADYGLEEAVGGYPYRTALNVAHSSATVRFAVDFKSPGELCTMKAIKKYKKPHFDIDPFSTAKLDEFQKWLENVTVLNVAGNSERRVPGIGKTVETWLVRAIGGTR